MATDNQAAKYIISVGGIEITQKEPKGLEELTIEDGLDTIGMAEMSFIRGDKGQVDWGSLKIGDAVSVQVGDGGRKMFVGTITALNHSDEHGQAVLNLKCKDPLAKIAATRNTKTWEDKTDSDVVSEVLGGKAGIVDSTPVTRKHTFQRNESDYRFLRRLAARNGYILTANEGKIDFKKPQFSAPAVQVPREKLMNLDYKKNTEAIPQTLKVIGWDYVKKEKIEGSASSGDIIPIGGGTNSVAGGGQTYSGEMTISDVQVHDQAEAKQMAVAELNRLSRQGVRGTASMQGSSDYFAGNKVKFQGHESGFNAEVLIVSAQHRVSIKEGFQTQVTFCSNTLPT